MNKKSTTPGNRTKRRQNAQMDAEAVIPVTMQSRPSDGDEIGTAEIPVAIQGSSGSEPGTVLGKAEIPVTMPRIAKRGARGARRNRSGASMRVIPVATRSHRGHGHSSPKAKPAEPKVSLDERRRNRAMRDPIVRVINTAMNLEQGTVEIAAQIGLAAIGAAESVARLLLPSPSITRRAHEVSESLPWPLDEAVERVAEWPEEEQAA